MSPDKICGKTGENNEPNKHWDINSPKMVVFIEHDIYGHTFLLLSQEYGQNYIIGHTFLLLPQEYGHKSWVHIVIIIDDHGTKMIQDPVHIQFICFIKYDHNEMIIPCNNISNNIVQLWDKYILWELKVITTC